MPHKPNKGLRKPPVKAPQKAVKPRKVVALGERDPDTMTAESAADNARNTRRWSTIRKSVMATGGLTGFKSTGYGN